MNRWCVYKHTNRKDGKAYIGMCRWPNYQNRWSNGNGYKQAPRFWPEIEKAGWDAFEHAILFYDLDLKEANRLEQEMIAKYKTNDPEHGYNVTAGGAGFSGVHHTAEARERISMKLKAYEKTELHRKHLSECKSGAKHPRSKKVYQLTKDGTLVKVWDYMQQASDKLGITKTNISACCLGKRPSAGGYKWTYERG